MTCIIQAGIWITKSSSRTFRVSDNYICMIYFGCTVIAQHGSQIYDVRLDFQCVSSIFGAIQRWGLMKMTRSRKWNLQAVLTFSYRIQPAYFWWMGSFWENVLYVVVGPNDQIGRGRIDPSWSEARSSGSVVWSLSDNRLLTLWLVPSRQCSALILFLY